MERAKRPRCTGGMRRWLLLLVTAATLCSASATAAATSTGLARPLRLPSVGPGERCPTSAGRPIDTLARGRSRMLAVGPGPAYVLSVGGAPAGRLRVAGAYRDPKGWVGQKSPWLIAPSYRGPVLVRGARVDAPGELRFAFGYGQHLRSLYLPAHQRVQRSGWRAWPSATLVRGAGCYAYQVDGTSFSRVIVIRVIWSRPG
jgi:hypothetical protein